MNTVNTSTSAVKILLISVITMVVSSGTAAIADQVGPSRLAKTVSFQDLDLSTVLGRQIAQDRIHHMAHVLCDQVADPTDMSHHMNYLACVDAAAASAAHSLQALIDRKSIAQFARTDVK